MKLSSFAALLGATLGLALPIQEVLDQASPSRTPSASKELPSPHHVAISWPENLQEPALQEYIERLEDELPFIRSNEKEYNLVASIQKPTPTADAEPARSSYAMVLGTWSRKPQIIENETHAHSAPCPHPADLVKDFLDIVDRNGPECVAIAIFVLIPLIYFALALLEVTVKYCIKERFPRRGRDPIRLSGPERQIRAWTNIQREMMVESEKQWWKTRQTRS